jgi:hypothetical protein
VITISVLHGCTLLPRRRNTQADETVVFDAFGMLGSSLQARCAGGAFQRARSSLM